MLKTKVLYLILLLSMSLNAEILEIEDDVNTTSRKKDDVKFAVEMGTQTDFWNPGLSGNVLEYDTKGLFLGFGKLKVKIYDSDVFTNDKIYLLIDEYDQFANAILAHSMQDFLKMVSKGGFVRSFYEVLKGATQNGVVKKMFITGVTPITLVT